MEWDGMGGIECQCKNARVHAIYQALFYMWEKQKFKNCKIWTAVDGVRQ